MAPNPILLTGSIRLELRAEDPDQDSVTFRVRWYADDRLLEGQTGTTLDGRLLKRGMRVRAEVIATDGKSESAPYQTEIASVANTPPEVRIVTPEMALPKAGDRIRLRVESSDADDDSVDYTYRWWRNTALVAEGTQAELDTTGFARGDIVMVEVTPYDGSGPGRPLMSDPIMIGNSPPAISSTPPTQLQQGHYAYTVMAVDADGDPLSYSLEAAPQGMTIDKATGRIDWQVSPDMRGAQRVKVVVQDGQNGQAFQEFELTPRTTPSS
jgi:hypothetical protein